MGSQGFEPRSWDVSCLSTPVVFEENIRVTEQYPL